MVDELSLEDHLIVLADDPKGLIAQLGETDQAYLNQSTPELAIIRAEIRQRLALHSMQKAEQLYLLHEAAAILELMRLEIDEQSMFERLSAQLGSVYIQHYHVTHEQKYLIVARQILRPLSHLAHPAILLGLVRADAAQGQWALVQHWLKRMQQHRLLDVELLEQTPELVGAVHFEWFVRLKAQFLN